MADSPFAAEDEALAYGGPEPPSSLGLATSVPGVGKQRLDAALAAMAALGMFLPVGKGVKGLATALGLGGGLSLASGVASAQRSKMPKPESSDEAIKIANPGAQAAPSFSQNDEYTEQLNGLLQQREIWLRKLGKGPPKPETQQQIDNIDTKIKSIVDARAARAADAEAGNLEREKSAADLKKAKEAETVRNYYRIGGGAAGLGAGALIALLSRGKGRQAAASFDRAGAMAEDIAPRGNLLVTKGNAGPNLHAAVNDAYRAGGAKEPFPSLNSIYAAENQTGLRTAKKDFLGATARAPSDSPFSPANAKAVTQLPKMVEWGIPGSLAAEAALTGGAAAIDPNPERADMLRNAAWGGVAGLAGYGLARKTLSPFATPKPSDSAMRAVNAGRERLQRDVQTIGLKDLKAFGKSTNELATAELPAARALPKKTTFTPGTPAEMAALREHKDTTVRSARVGFVGDALSQPGTGDKLAQALYVSRDATGRVDRDALRYQLRQLLGTRVMFKGQSVRVDNQLVAEMIKSLGALGR